MKIQYNVRIKTTGLFAGAGGGLALGIEKAGFDTIGLIEADENAAKTLKQNRPKWNVIHDDIANISPLNLEKEFSVKKWELDLLSGGAPCQAFSYAGKRLGFEDTRGTLLYHYAVFLQKLQPKMFLFENVRGLLTHDKGRTYQTMLNVFEAAGYTIQKEILNAWDYGVAQKRERLITIGIRNDLTDLIYSTNGFNTPTLGSGVLTFSSEPTQTAKRDGESWIFASFVKTPCHLDFVLSKSFWIFSFSSLSLPQSFLNSRGRFFVARS